MQENRGIAAAKNQCAGPFGAVYDFYIERPWLVGVIGRLVWGMSARPMYEAIEELGRVGDGATIVDAPCGGGVALRGLRHVAGVPVTAQAICAARTRLPLKLLMELVRQRARELT